MDGTEINSTTEFNASLTGKICLQCGKAFADDETNCDEDGADLTRRAEAALIGTRIGNNYKIISLIGIGGMSAVYKARHELLDKVVAIKLLHSHLVQQIGSLK